MLAREWFTPAEIVAAKSPELPGTERGINMVADRDGWRTDPARARRRPGRGRANWEYHVSLLPAAAQTRLALLHSIEPTEPPSAPVQSEASKALWARYEGLSSDHKAECQKRLAALIAVDRYEAAGRTVSAAVGLAAAACGVSVRALFGWRKMVAGVDRADWRAALAPDYKTTATFAECHPRALDILLSDWLRPEKPSFSRCYRDMCKAASKNGWLPIPSERALRRRVEAEVPVGVIKLAREGRDKAKRLFPAQKRIRTHFHAMQAVNMDGHKFDVFVRMTDGTITRIHFLALQDLYSGTILAWRLAEGENKETVRLVVGDMVERHGIPEKVYLDNGRAFASKWITGRMPNRFRFTIRDEDPAGILTTLGCEVTFTKPYSGQSKPIERMFRDLADSIAKHPVCAGAYTGNRPDAKPENYGNAAIPLEAFRDHVARQVEEHNSRTGRRSEACRGRSFLETFQASLAEPTTLIRWPSEGQRSLWLLAAEKLTAQRGSGEIHFLGNRYWSAELNAHAGTKVVLRFDPEKLQQPVQVYTLDDRLICEAQCIAATGFDDQTAARIHERDRAAFMKAQREQLRLNAKLSADELARLYGADDKPAEPAPMPPKFKRIANAGRAAVAAQPVSEDEFESSFSRGLRLIEGEADILPFPPRRAEDG
jgi:putative transposase